MLSIKITDPSAALKGTYEIVAFFSAPGIYSWPLGLKLEVFDICDASTFPSAPIVTPDQKIFYEGQEDILV